MEQDNDQRLPYWLINVPRNKWPAKCPEYLQDLSVKDIEQLSVPDKDYQRYTWKEVQDIVETNRLDSFYRVPSDLRRYRWYTAKLIREYGSVMNYMLQERLEWTSLDPEDPKPFASQADYKILRNDWPYGIDGNIVHLVVWTKTVFPADPTTGVPTDQSVTLINAFVQRTFGHAVSKDRLIWFKNPIALRSVAAVEHFHVMLYEPSPDFIEKVTDEDTPTSERVGVGLEDEYL